MKKGLRFPCGLESIPPVTNDAAHLRIQEDLVSPLWINTIQVQPHNSLSLCFWTQGTVHARQHPSPLLTLLKFHCQEIGVLQTLWLFFSAHPLCGSCLPGYRLSPQSLGGGLAQDIILNLSFPCALAVEYKKPLPNSVARISLFIFCSSSWTVWV